MAGHWSEMPAITRIRFWPGISDAFRSSEWVADAVHAGFSGARPLDEAMAEYQRVRDEHFAPLYDLSCGMAGLEPPTT